MKFVLVLTLAALLGVAPTSAADDESPLVLVPRAEYERVREVIEQMRGLNEKMFRQNLELLDEIKRLQGITMRQDCA